MIQFPLSPKENSPFTMPSLKSTAWTPIKIAAAALMAIAIIYGVIRFTSLNGRVNKPNPLLTQPKPQGQRTLNIKFSNNILSLTVNSSDTLKDLIDKISSMEPLKNAWLESAIVAGKNLRNEDPHMTIDQRNLITGATIYIVPTPKFSPTEWTAYAEEYSDVLRLCPGKPVATPHSGSSPRTLAKNWDAFTEEGKAAILDDLSNRITGKTDRVQVHVQGGHLTFYLEKHLTQLLSIAGKNVPEILALIARGGVKDPEILSLIYIMFGDLLGLSHTPQHEKDLTKEGRRVFQAYRTAIDR